MRNFTVGQTITVGGHRYLIFEVMPNGVQYVGIHRENYGTYILDEGNVSDWDLHTPEHDMPIVLKALARNRADLGEVNKLRDAARRERDEVLAKLESVNDALIQEAINRDWCEDFQTFAENNGLRGVEREWEVYTKVEMNVLVSVTAPSESAAREMVDEDKNNVLTEAFRSMTGAHESVEFEDVTVVDVEAV